MCVSFAVRSVAFMAGLPGPPVDVTSAIQLLCEFFHVEARLMLDLAVSESATGGPGPEQLHPDIRHAAEKTDHQIRAYNRHDWHIENVSFSALGSTDDLESLRVFAQYAVDQRHYRYTLRQLLLHIQANFMLRERLLTTHPQPVSNFE